MVELYLNVQSDNGSLTDGKLNEIRQINAKGKTDKCHDI